MLAVVGSVTTAALGAWGVRKYLKGRPSEAELERRRRTTLHARGKTGDFSNTAIMWFFTPTPSAA